MFAGAAPEDDAAATPGAAPEYAGLFAGAAPGDDPAAGAGVVDLAGAAPDDGRGAVDPAAGAAGAGVVDLAGAAPDDGRGAVDSAAGAAADPDASTDINAGTTRGHRKVCS